MKLIRCNECSTPLALTYAWLNCECEQSGGAYCVDGDRCVVAGPCQLIGVDNRVFFGLRTEAFPYDETKQTKAGKAKVTRLVVNPGFFPERVPA